MINQPDFIALEISSNTFFNNTSQLLIQKSGRVPAHFSERNSPAVVNLPIWKQTPQKFAFRRQQRRFFIHQNADNLIPVVRNQIIGIKPGIRLAVYRNFAVRANNIQEISIQIISVGFIQHPADITAVFTEHIAISTDTTNRLPRKRDNQAIR